MPKDMTAPEFVTASLQEHRSDLLSLNVAYMSWVFAEVDKFFGVRCADVVGMEAPDYVASILDKLRASAPPQGLLPSGQTSGTILRDAGCDACLQTPQRSSASMSVPNLAEPGSGNLSLSACLPMRLALGGGVPDGTIHEVGTSHRRGRGLHRP